MLTYATFVNDPLSILPEKYPNPIAIGTGKRTDKTAPP
jgi:hypothetical protein